RWRRPGNSQKTGAGRASRARASKSARLTNAMAGDHNCGCREQASHRVRGRLPPARHQLALAVGDRRKPQPATPGTHTTTASSRATAYRTTGPGVAARVAVLVAVHRRAGGSTRDQPRRLVQVEPIWTIVTRAANAVWVHAHPGFKSPSLRRSQAFLPERTGGERA